MKHERSVTTFLSAAANRAPIRLIVGVVLFQLIAPGVLEAHPQVRQVIPVENVKVFETSTAPQAVALAVYGKCDYSNDGTTFEKLKAGRVFKEGAVLRTSEDARIDLFFRRIGTAVRIQPDSDVKLEKMARRLSDGVPVMDTLLDLRKGRIFIVVRSLVTGSTLEIRNAAGRSVVEGGGGKGRYIITADGTQVTDKNSVVPLKMFGEKGITVITPGQEFHASDGKLLPLATPEAEAMLIDLDELDSLAEELTAPEDLPSRK
ncbi:MAG: hypothetical protein ACYDH9_21120 [Limisphaerales bacterium]